MRHFGWTIATAVVLMTANVGWLLGDAALAERMAGAMQFDRAAIVAGQWWRLLSGQLVHYSATHFAMDLSAWAAVGLMFERRLGRLWPLATLLGAAGVGVGLLVAMPELELYRGWSGLCNTAMAVGLYAAAWPRAEGADAGRDGWAKLRLAAVAVVAVLWVVKISCEAFTGDSTMSLSPAAMGRMTPLAHWLGAAAGALAVAGDLAVRSARRGRSGPAGGMAAGATAVGVGLTPRRFAGTASARGAAPR